MEIKRIAASLSARENFAAGVYTLMVAQGIATWQVAMEDLGLSTAVIDVDCIRNYIRLRPALPLTKLITGEPVVTTLRSYITDTKRSPRDSMKAAVRILTNQFTDMTPEDLASLVTAAAIASRANTLTSAQTIHWRMSSASTVQAYTTTTYQIT